MDCSPPGSSVHGVSQARILEWVVISFCRGSCPPRDWAGQVDSSPLSHLGSPRLQEDFEQVCDMITPGNVGKKMKVNRNVKAHYAVSVADWNLLLIVSLNFKGRNQVQPKSFLQTILIVTSYIPTQIYMQKNLTTRDTTFNLKILDGLFLLAPQN